MILYFNVDKKLSTAINDITRSTSMDYTSVFIEWIPTIKGTNQKKVNALLNQTEILEKYGKTLPIVIFDKYRSMTKTEYNWLKKFKVTFFEPSIHTREGFKYLPNWTIIKTIKDIKLNDNKRSVNIGYIGPLTDKITSFEKYYTNINIPDDVSVTYYSKNIPSNKKNEYDEVNISNKLITYDDIEFSVIIGNINDYAVGHLDSFYFDALAHNCIPLIPKENRYYSSLMNVDFVDWYEPFWHMYETIYVGMITSIYSDIQKYYPEMNVTYTAEVIKKYLYEK